MNEKEAPELISVGVQSLVDRASSLGLTWNLRMATVTNGTNPAAILAQYDNDDQSITMVSTIGSLLVGTRVYCIAVPPAGNFIIGVFTTGPIVTNCECTNIFGMTANTTTSATFVTMPGTPTVRITKTSPKSRLRVDLAGTFFSTGAVAGLAAGVNLDVISSDQPITAVSSTNSSLGSHTTYAGHIMLDPDSISGGLPARDYVITGIWRRSGGAGTLNVDSGDIWSCCVEEVP